MDSILQSLSARKKDWPKVDPASRVKYLESAMAGILKVAPDWVAEANRRRKIDPDSPLAGEEWITGPAIALRQIRLLRDNLQSIARTGEPLPVPTRTDPDRRTIAKVLPGNLVDRLMYLRHTAEIWIAPGDEPTRAKVYKQPSEGRLCLVLGAGNISSIAPLDAIHKLMVENQVVVLKMNPVNDFLAPYLEAAFADLIRDGYLAIVTGDGGIGSALTRHPLVDTIHLTGSRQTYDAIRSDKPITAELGCVTPILVVPGKWSSSDIKHQALNVVGMATHNVGFNCNSGKVLVLDRGWNQREEFIQAIQNAMANTPPRHPYYPGAKERYNRFMERYPQAIRLGDSQASLPWTFIPDVKPDNGEYALQTEPFCGILSEVSLDGTGDPDAFLKQAVPFANSSIDGDLSCTILAKETRSAPLRDAIRDLRYGGVSVNAWSAMIYGIGNTHWGAAPGNTPDDIRSGTGSVHNCYLFDHPEKSVLYGPYRLWPKPVWFPDHQSLAMLGKAITEHECGKSPVTLLRVVNSAVMARSSF